MTDIKLTHPETKGSITVDESRVDTYKSQGWTEAEAKSTKGTDSK